MSFEPHEKAQLLSALKLLTEFVEKMPAKKSCATCLSWNGSACVKAGCTPPKEVQDTGCPEYDWDTVPF